jgi:hypothetical protein
MAVSKNLSRSGGVEQVPSHRTSNSAMFAMQCGEACVGRSDRQLRSRRKGGRASRVRALPDDLHLPDHAPSACARRSINALGLCGCHRTSQPVRAMENDLIIMLCWRRGIRGTFRGRESTFYASPEGVGVLT